jgi:tetratricopeptide (TPR) repeat protein
MSLNDFPLPRSRCSVASLVVNALLKTLMPLLLVIVINLNVRAANDAAPQPPSNVVVQPDPQLLRSVLILQEQLRNTQRAVELAREEAQADAKRSAEAVAARLAAIEQALNAQREQELADLRRSTYTMIIIVGISTAVGFIAVMVAGFLQMRAAARLTEVSRQFAALSHPRLLEPGSGSTLQLPGAGANVEAASANLLGAIDRLEHRLEEMESPSGGTHTATNGHKESAASVSTSSQISTVLSKGQALLNMDQPEEALDQFDEALRIEPRNIEAWIKRGTALERLQRVDEAITAYDQAIAIDGSTATAYLFKAGVYNRQKKYAEALQCYEKALNAQQKSRATQTP